MAKLLEVFGNSISGRARSCHDIQNQGHLRLNVDFNHGISRGKRKSTGLLMTDGDATGRNDQDRLSDGEVVRSPSQSTRGVVILGRSAVTRRHLTVSSFASCTAMKFACPAKSVGTSSNSRESSR